MVMIYFCDITAWLDIHFPRDLWFGAVWAGGMYRQPSNISGISKGDKIVDKSYVGAAATKSSFST